MKNEKVYEVTKTRTLTTDIMKARWKLWGHDLRLNENTPGRKVMKYLFIAPSSSAKKSRGKKRLTIVINLNKYIEGTKRNST